MDVTWDPEKNKKNIAERQLPLSLGGLVLDDEMRIERHDKKHSTPEEDRWQTIGKAGTATISTRRVFVRSSLHAVAQIIVLIYR